MMSHLVSDPALRAAFLDSLHELRAEVLSPEFARWLAERESEYLPLLRTEFPWLAPFAPQRVQARARELARVDAASFARYLMPQPARQMPHRPDADYPNIVLASLTLHNGGAGAKGVRSSSLPARSRVP